MGAQNEQIIVFLHSAGFVDVFHKLYDLAERYHIIVPHLYGNGEEVKSTFNSDTIVLDLNCLFQSLNKKMVVVGYRLGAELLISVMKKSPFIFEKSLLISPYLYKGEYDNERKKIMVKDKLFLKSRLLASLEGRFAGLSDSLLSDYVENRINMNLNTLNEMNLYRDDNGYNNIIAPMKLVYASMDKECIKNGAVRFQAETGCDIEQIKGKDLPLRHSNDIRKIIIDMCK